MPSPSEKHVAHDSFLRCTECGREETTNFSRSLRSGWPMCCSYTMRLERTEADIDAAVGDAFAPLGVPDKPKEES